MMCLQNIHKYYLKPRNIAGPVTAIIIALFIQLLFLPGIAMADSIADVISEVSVNLSDAECDLILHNRSGIDIEINACVGNIANGQGSVAICGPADSSQMTGLLDHITSAAGTAGTKATAMKGCEVREYRMEEGSAAAVILPEYLITVEIYESGNGSDWEIEKAKWLAQLTLDGLERHGFLNQAPQLDSQADLQGENMPGQPAAKQTDKPAPVNPAAKTEVKGAAKDEPVQVSNTNNIAGVGNGPTVPTTFTVDCPHLVTYIMNYHWNNSRGAAPGTIGLKDNSGNVYGPWQASGKEGQGGVPNAYWEVFPDIVVPAGTYTIIDSDPSTWAQNAESGGRGMGEVRATPNFDVTSGSIEDLDKDSGYNFPDSCECNNSHAGVGPVGNIPGPENTTEAVVGVAVPGLIATALGALAGLGGGGSFTPGGGIPVSPTSPGGSSPASGTPFPPKGRAGGAENNNQFDQLGRRRKTRTHIPEDGADSQIPSSGESVIKPQENTSKPAGDGTSNEDIYISQQDSGNVHSGGILIDTGAIESDRQQEDIILDDRSVGVLSKPGTQAEELKKGTSAQTVQGESIYNPEDSTKEAFDQNGFDSDGYDRKGYDRSGFDRDGYDKAGYDKDGFNKDGFNKEGYKQDGYDQKGYDRKGFDKDGYDKAGYDKDGFNKEGYDSKGYNRDGYNQEGYDRKGFDQDGYDQDGYDGKGFDQAGYDKAGYDESGFNRDGYNKDGYDSEGYNQKGYNREGYNQDGYDLKGFDKAGFDEDGYDREGYNESGYDRDGFNKDGYNSKGYDVNGYDKNGYNKEGFDEKGFNRDGYDKDGYDSAGFNAKGFDRKGFDQKGFNEDGFDSEGYAQSGLDKYGYDREGYDVNGYDKHGYNRRGYDAKGFDRNGYDEEGFNKEGWDKDGYGSDGLNKEGYDRDGFDKDGYDKEGYNRDGYNREGLKREGYDEYGYDKNGFNKDGFDSDGYDREGFDYKGYNRSGYDPWGFNRQGYDKEGYHWSGYNADGYDRNGRHWSESPHAGGESPFDVAVNPFEADQTIIIGEWQPQKPPLGEPYPRTLEKYGAKPWTNEPEVPKKPESPSEQLPSGPGEDSGSGPIGPENPMETLKQHDPGKPPEIPDDKSMPENIPNGEGPGDQGDVPPQTDTGSNEPVPDDSESGTTEDLPVDEPQKSSDGTIVEEVYNPETGEWESWEYPEDYTGPRHGETQILVGETDGRTYEITFDAKSGRWINKETGNYFDPDRFEKWQDDLAEDRRRADADLDKMIKREDANSKAIDEHLKTFDDLQKMEKLARKYGIGNKGGPGDVEKAIDDLKNDMIDGKEIDKDKMERIRRIIKGNIKGDWKEDTGRRWEEKPWYEDIDSALKANAETVKEMVTGEDADGNTSWLGLGSRIMIGVATGGSSEYGLTVAEAMYRIKEGVEKGDSDFKAVSKAIGLVILDESISRYFEGAAKWGVDEMARRFPALTSKVADTLETAVLNVMKADQTLSSKLGLIGKEGAGETIDQINKRLGDLSADAAEEAVERAGRTAADAGEEAVERAGRTAADAGEEAAERAGRTAADAGEEAAERAGRTAADAGEEAAERAGRTAAEAGEEAAEKAGKTAAEAGEEAAERAGKTAAEAGEEAAERAGKTAADAGEEAGDAAQRARQRLGDNDDFNKMSPDEQQRIIDDQVSGEQKAIKKAERSGKDFTDLPPDKREQMINDQIQAKNQARENAGSENFDNMSPEQQDRLIQQEVAGRENARNTVQDSIDDFDNLSPRQKEELVRQQQTYDEYRIQAEENCWDVADKVQRGENLTVEDALNLKSDPASMRTLKDLREVDGLGAELGEGGTRHVQTEVNNVLNEQIYQPSYRDVEGHLSSRYGGADIRVETVRTPGKEYHSWDVNTDNDIIALRRVDGPDGPEWVEIPRGEWEDVYYKSFAQNSGFSPEDAARRFPGEDWGRMSDAEQCRRWAELHGESPTDVYHAEAARDFSRQRTAILGGERPLVEATPEEIERGVEVIYKDGRPMRPVSGSEMAQRGQGDLLDSEGLGLMEKNKVNHYWNEGSMRSQTEAMEQLRKTAEQAKALEKGYCDMGYKINDMPDNMQKAIDVVNNRRLSPTSRAARLQELGYDTPGDLTEKISSRIGSLRIARR